MTYRHGHAGKRTPTYRSWESMKCRCNNPNMKDYHRYGGRGITVCDRWNKSFKAFLTDMGERPTGKTLERRDVMLGYTPDNCEWATPLQQARNQERYVSAPQKEPKP